MTTNDSHPQAPTVADTASYAGSPRHLQFLAVSFVWLLVVYAVSRGPAMEVSAVGLGMLLLGVPMCMAGICTNALRRHRWLPALFRKQGRLYKLLSKGLMSILFWTIAGLFISFFMLLQFHVHEPLEWAVVAATIPLFTLLFAFLSRLLEQLREYWRRERPQRWLFPNQLLARPMTRAGAAHIYKRAKDKAQIRKAGGIHTLRHAYATGLLEAGVELPVIQRRLGHTSIRSTMRYLHLAQDKTSATPSPLDLLEFPRTARA